MTQEKLHRLSISMVDNATKIRWLEIWISDPLVRDTNMFPTPERDSKTQAIKVVSDHTFDQWLHKATFWSQVRQLQNHFGMIVHICALSQILMIFLAAIGKPSGGNTWGVNGRLQNPDGSTPDHTGGLYQEMEARYLEQLLLQGV